MTSTSNDNGCQENFMANFQTSWKKLIIFSWYPFCLLWSLYTDIIEKTHTINIFLISIRFQNSSDTSLGSILFFTKNLFEETFSVLQCWHFPFTSTIDENFSLHVKQMVCFNLSIFLWKFFRRFHSNSLNSPIGSDSSYVFMSFVPS